MIQSNRAVLESVWGYTGYKTQPVFSNFVTKFIKADSK
jgi:hypothetical protein